MRCLAFTPTPSPVASNSPRAAAATLIGFVTTLAGSSGVTGYNDGYGSEALFNGPNGIGFGPNASFALIVGSAFLEAGSAGAYLMLFFVQSDYDNFRIRMVDTTSALVTTLAGGGTQGYRNGWGPNVTLGRTRHVAVDRQGKTALIVRFNHDVTTACALMITLCSGV